jgi:hypothetical protein
MSGFTTDEKTLSGHVYDERSLSLSTTSLFHVSGFVVRYLVGFVRAALSLLFRYIRRTDTEFLGWKVGMVGGVVPLECVVCCALVGWLGVEEWGKMEGEVVNK